MEIDILKWFESIHNPACNYIMYGFTLLAEKGIFWILLSLLMLTLLPKKYRKVGFTSGIALFFSIVFCNFILKNVVERVRPFWNEDGTAYIFEQLFGLFDKIDDWSFPSGHTSAAFAAATAIFMWRKKEGIIALVVAFFIGVSRLYLNVHWPTDVVIGALLGITCGVLAFFVAKLFIKKIGFVNRWFEKEEPYFKKKA